MNQIEQEEQEFKALMNSINAMDKEDPNRKKMLMRARLMRFSYRDSVAIEIMSELNVMLAKHGLKPDKELNKKIKLFMRTRTVSDEQSRVLNESR